MMKGKAMAAGAMVAKAAKKVGKVAKKVDKAMEKKMKNK
jgi:hypothetical protein